MLEELIGKKVVIDMKSPYVCMGTLLRFDEHFLEVENADLHDLRDVDKTREAYIASVARTGIQRNRKKSLLFRHEMVAICRLSDIVDV